MDQQAWARAELKRRIEVAKSSGIGITKFARNTLIRDPSTVHRWLRGGKITDVVCDWLLGNWRVLEDGRSVDESVDE